MSKNLTINVNPRELSITTITYVKLIVDKSDINYINKNNRKRIHPHFTPESEIWIFDFKFR